MKFKPEMCSECQEKPAEYDEELVWILWKYNPKTGLYSRKPTTMCLEPIESNHLCEECKTKKGW